MTCVSALEVRHDAVAAAPSLASMTVPTFVAYRAPRLPLAITTFAFATALSPPPANTPLVIRLQTLLI